MVGKLNDKERCQIKISDVSSPKKNVPFAVPNTTFDEVEVESTVLAFHDEETVSVSDVQKHFPPTTDEVQQPDTAQHF